MTCVTTESSTVRTARTAAAVTAPFAAWQPQGHSYPQDALFDLS